tara:strand:+ start:1597 stop:2181 length:585 start_codon:yes stop_codon:yes gene_type:complete
MSFLYLADNVVPKEIFNLAHQEIYYGSIWTMTNTSHIGDTNNGFGAIGYCEKINKSIREGKFNEMHIMFNLWNAINSKVKIEKKFKNVLKKVHINCGPPLFDQTVHTDEEDNIAFSKDITVLFFIHELWNHGWGGEFLLYDLEKTKVIAGTFPMPNRVAVFEAYLPHRGVTVSRICPIMRVSVAFQCEFDNTLK